MFIKIRVPFIISTENLKIRDILHNSYIANCNCYIHWMINSHIVNDPISCNSMKARNFTSCITDIQTMKNQGPTPGNKQKCQLDIQKQSINLKFIFRCAATHMQHIT